MSGDQAMMSGKATSTQPGLQSIISKTEQPINGKFRALTNMVQDHGAQPGLLASKMMPNNSLRQTRLTFPREPHKFPSPLAAPALLLFTSGDLDLICGRRILLNRTLQQLGFLTQEEISTGRFMESPESGVIPGHLMMPRLIRKAHR